MRPTGPTASRHLHRASRTPSVCPTHAHGHATTPPACLPASPRQRNAAGLPPWCRPDRSSLSFLPLLSPSPPVSMAEPRTSAAVAAARLSLGHRPPLALPTRPEEPQRRPRRLCRATRHLPPCITGYLAFFLLGRRRSRPPARRLQSLPRAAELLFDFAVSPSAVPLYPPCQFLPLASFVVAAESFAPPAT